MSHNLYAATFLFQGDGGAPLVCKVPETNQFEAVGLVAWGIGKARLRCSMRAI